MKNSRLTIVLLYCLTLSLAGCLPEGCNGPDENPYTTLEQGWSKRVQEKFWFTSQGSRLIPYAWFLALEVVDSEQLFKDESHMREYSYIPFPSFKLNPDALPIGFVRGGGKNKEWLGLTCAACHTNVLEHEGKAYLIDGAPTLADFTGFYDDMVSAMEATHRDDAKFERFAERVSGSASLRDELGEFAASSRARRGVNHSSLEHGFARLDAFGEILNQVMVFDLDEPGNRTEPDAPVSYPFLWGISQSDVVQWNGVAKNSPPIVGALGRNTGEVLGVFGTINIEGEDIPHYDSSVERRNLLRMEHWIRRLRAPKWAETSLPALEPEKVAAGKKIYRAAKCLSCHGTTSAKDYKAKMTPISVVGTDPRMARNFTSREGRTGVLEGHPKKLNPLDKFGERGCGSDILSNAVLGAILGRPMGGLLQDAEALPEDVLSLTGGKLPNMEGAAEAFREGESGSCFDGDSYKARPLDGIWATAPYLHNGSVPNLWELLQPENERARSFKVGSRKFDPVNVGYVTDEGGFELDTSLDGNRNTGHTWGVDLGEEDKWALIEYTKSL